MVCIVFANDIVLDGGMGRIGIGVVVLEMR